MSVWRDGDWIVGGDALPADDRGLTLGDGLFETLLAKDGRLIHPGLHFRRLTGSAAALGLPPPPDAERLEDIAVQAVTRSGLEQGRAAVRMTLTAGSSDRGLARAPHAAPRILITASRAPEAGTPVRVVTVDVRRNPASPSSRHKTLSYIDNVMALREAQALGADEALLLNIHGRPTCAAAANIILLVDGEMVTPALSEGVLAGTTRERLLGAVPDLAARPVSPTEALRASGLVLTNALRGVRPALAWDGRALPDSTSLAQRLRSALEDDAR